MCSWSGWRGGRGWAEGDRAPSAGVPEKGPSLVLSWKLRYWEPRKAAAEMQVRDEAKVFPAALRRLRPEHGHEWRPAWATEQDSDSKNKTK